MLIIIIDSIIDNNNSRLLCARFNYCTFAAVFTNYTVRMELRQLRYFVSVAETNSFSEASRLLNITQSTLSQQVKQLENELGVMLFERSSHRVCLTDVGEAFLPEARRTLHAADVWEADITRKRKTKLKNQASTFIACQAMLYYRICFHRAS